jgi:hypothetical protein
MKVLNYCLLLTLTAQPFMHADETIFSLIGGWLTRNATTLGICTAFTALNWYKFSCNEDRCKDIANKEYTSRNTVIKNEFIDSNLVQSMLGAQYKNNPNYQPKNTTTLGIMAEFTDMLFNAQNEQLNEHEQKIEQLSQQIKILLPNQEMPQAPKPEVQQKLSNLQKGYTIAQHLIISKPYNNKIFNARHPFAKKNSKASEMVNLIEQFREKNK